MEAVALFLMVIEYERRVKKACADVQLNELMEAHVNQEVFLSNESSLFHY